MEHELFALQDKAYKAFKEKLIPTVKPEAVIGVRVPALRAMAKTLTLEDLGTLPHRYHEENLLHGFLIEKIKDYNCCIAEIERFLPYVDNWEVCDGITPKCMKAHKKELLEQIKLWLRSKHPYTVRYGIKMLMTWYLDEEFEASQLAMVAGVQSEEYYVNMMAAWYFATALAKQYEAAVFYLENGKLLLWVHNKTIQKAVESFRITEEQKAYLRSLRR